MWPMVPSLAHGFLRTSVNHCVKSKGTLITASLSLSLFPVVKVSLALRIADEIPAASSGSEL